ncbi:Holliday junction branch migration protein RuvA [Lachnospiraceae bacterium MD308]|nr:Holliday junction branch migration protein RuvA [Lachnospiraceae bacterium MD308]MCI8579998.1 Holliday junction branch migration protein RuvA [Dorea sp.]
MIQFIRGKLVSVEEDRAIVDVNGVGYGIFMSVQSLSLLPQTGSEVKIHTYLNVKEDAMQLFGFLTRDDLMIFRLLIGVNGIGPKGGQAILSVLSPDDLRFAVLAGDVKAISAAPGIGKKTAEKLILELRDKLKIEDALEHKVSETVDSGRTGKGADHVQSEAVQALVALGYGSTEALRAVKQVPSDEGTDVESVLKAALKILL